MKRIGVVMIVLLGAASASAAGFDPWAWQGPVQQKPVAPKEADYPEIARKRVVQRSVEVVRQGVRRTLRVRRVFKRRIFKRRSGCRKLFRLRRCG